MPVLFVDIDGPLIPGRSYVGLSPAQKRWDLSAVAMVNRLLERSKAKLVISSAWSIFGRDELMNILIKVGLDCSNLHSDWSSFVGEDGHRLEGTREIMIQNWLDAHPTAKQYAALDDNELIRKLKCGVFVSFEDGMMLSHYRLAAKYLDCEEYLHFDPPRSPRPSPMEIGIKVNANAG